MEPQRLPKEAMRWTHLEEENMEGQKQHGDGGGRVERWRLGERHKN